MAGKAPRVVVVEPAEPRAWRDSEWGYDDGAPRMRRGKALAESRHTVTLGFRQPARGMFASVPEASRAATPHAN
jgi:hypothetical protein